MNEIESLPELMHTTVDIWADVTYESEDTWQAEGIGLFIKRLKYAYPLRGCWRPYCVGGGDLNQNWTTRN